MIEIVLQAAIDFRLTLAGGAGVILNAQNQLHRREDPVGLLHHRSRPEAAAVQGPDPAGSGGTVVGLPLHQHAR